MNKPYILAIFSLIFGLMSSIAYASTIFLSGDINIADALPGGETTNNAGNEQFFTNILQGGTEVAVLSGRYDTTRDVYVNNYYNSLSGVTSSIITGTVSTANLAGIDLFVSLAPTDSFTASETTALSNLLGAGGSIFLAGEDFGANEITIVNAALAAIGSSMSILPNSQFEPLYHIATGSQIVADPYTSGISSLTYAAPFEIDASGGTTLFLGSNMQPFIAYETSTIPIPATVWLLGSGLLGLVGVARRKSS